jgi:acetylornithine deacetylase/succinyl-diaminopimelate desuccinylase-like protein
MKDIYNCAECVLAWLGASDEHDEFVPKKLEAAGQHIRRRRAEQNYTMSENNDSWVWVWVYGKNLFMSFTNGDSDLPLHFMGHTFYRGFWQRA